VKKGRLWKQHALIGSQLFLDPRSDFDEVSQIVALNHHERWDGKGYPGHIHPFTGQPLAGHIDDEGRPIPKKGEEIPLFGRIVAIADVFDALSSKRCYKDAWSEQDVLAELKKQAGQQFDPELVEIFLSITDVIRSIQQRYPDRE
jgi:response regulator RpfG family c-di-GMP phosphodiesterase